jgi:hypothetical protein
MPGEIDLISQSFLVSQDAEASVTPFYSSSVLGIPRPGCGYSRERTQSLLSVRDTAKDFCKGKLRARTLPCTFEHPKNRSNRESRGLQNAWP